MADIRLTREDFLSIKFDEHLKNDYSKESHQYSRDILKLKDKLKAVGNENEKLEHILRIISDITSYQFNLDSKHNPFEPFLIINGKRSASIEDLSDNELIFLDEILEEITIPEINARIADVLWVRKKNYKRAIYAINNYIDVYNQVSCTKHWFMGIERLERAVQLVNLFKKDEIRDSLISTIKKDIDKSYKSHETTKVKYLVELIIKITRDDLQKYIEILTVLANIEEKEENWSLARELWNLCSNCLTIIKRFDKRDQVKQASANTYVMEAEKALKETSSYFIAAAHLQSAIESYRRIEGTTEIVNKLHIKLLEYQKKAVAELTEFSTEEIDITKIAENCVEEVKGKPFNNKLIILTLLSRSPNLNDLKRTAENILRENPLINLMPTTKVNTEGRVISKAPSLLSNQELDFEQRVRIEMLNNSNYHRQITVEAVIEPVRRQIMLEHFVMVRHLMPLVVDNPFIPAGREEIYALGLYYGLQGEFVESTHLLIPQIEHSIRYILSNEGEIVSSIDSDGIQEEKNLNSLLSIPKLNEIFGEDLVFDLQGLLIDKHGINLRNNISHGLNNFNDFFSSASIYLWWLTLKLCVSYKI
ncbi:DUF4209 domain-containing protein [Metabacillus idriensis]|uniref:DUF4209 domain-containing protein n=1 Tax=Metabacillus idriensis TaxID=324768 RepID=UPI0017491391|nr:DUF4209 domain-containing protein [Metabacillus idriensis]